MGLSLGKTEKLIQPNEYEANTSNTSDIVSNQTNNSMNTLVEKPTNVVGKVT